MYYNGYTCHMVESYAEFDQTTGLEYVPYRVYTHDFYEPYGIRYYGPYRDTGAWTSLDGDPDSSHVRIRLGSLDVAWKVASVVSEADENWDYSFNAVPVSTTGKKWVNLYQYSNDTPAPTGGDDYSSYHKINRHITPAAVDWTEYVATTYNTTTELYDPPTLPSIEDGLVRETTFSNGRSATAVIRNGDSTTEYVTPVTMTRHAERPDLLTQVVRQPGSTLATTTPVETTDYTYGFTAVNGAVSVVSWVRIDETAESESQNGPGDTNPPVQHTSFRMYDKQGQLRWSQDAHGTLTYYEYDALTGARTLMVRDADPSGSYVDTTTVSLPGSFPNLSVSGDWSIPSRSDYEELTDTYTVDELGRMVSHTDPSGNTRYVTYEVRDTNNVQDSGALADRGVPYMTTLSFPHQLSDNSYDGPVSMSFRDASGRSIRESSFTLFENASYDPLNGFYIPVDEVQRSDTERLISGVAARSRAWHDISNTTAVSSGTLEEHLNEGSYVTHYEYDTLGRTLKVIDPEGGVMAYSEYDIRDRGIATEMGTRNWSTGNDDTHLVSKVYFDSDQSLTQGVGNGNVTVQESYPGEGNIRTTSMWYDFRDRLIAQENPEAPHSVFAYDDLDRVVEQARITTSTMPSTPPAPSSSTNRSSYTRMHYSNRGMLYKSETAINPAQSSPSYLETNQWFDEVGNVVASWSPNSASVKYEYDTLDRPTVVYQTDRGGDAAPGAADNYEDAATVAGDQVISQAEYSYIANGVDGAGQIEVVTNRLRHHDTTATGALTTSSSVSTYTGYVYDDAGRQTHTLNYGTGDSDGFVSNTSAPTPSISSPDALISSIGFDEWGRVDRVFDPEGKETRTLFDDLSRTIATIESRTNLYASPSSNEITWDGTADNWKVTWPTAARDLSDRDRVTSFVYDGNSNVIKRTAHLTDGTAAGLVQVTQYAYGTSEASSSSTMNSLINSSNLLSAVHYPNEDTGAADTSSAYTVSYAYNRLGELRGTTDQNGTVHKLTRDDLGRITIDEAETLGGGIDGGVREITASFDEHGRIQDIESLNNSSSVVNAVKFTYTPLHQIAKVYQEHDGVVNTSGTVSDSMEYTYTDATISGNSGNY